MKVDQKRWSDFLNEIGYKQVELFQENNLSYMNLMVNGISLKNLLCSCYSSLLTRKNIPQIERLPQEEKVRLFEIVKEFENKEEPLEKESITAACRALYTLEYYIMFKP